jgi:hypothetical protein
MVSYFFHRTLTNISLRVFINSIGGPAAHICQAAIAALITATTWLCATDIRLYFVDQTHQIREFSVTLHNNNFYDFNWCIAVPLTDPWKSETLGDLKILGLCP